MEIYSSAVVFLSLVALSSCDGDTRAFGSSGSYTDTLLNGLRRMESQARRKTSAVGTVVSNAIVDECYPSCPIGTICATDIGVRRCVAAPVVATAAVGVGYSDPLLASAAVGSGYSDPLLASAAVGSGYSDPLDASSFVSSGYNDPIFSNAAVGSGYNDPMIASAAVRSDYRDPIFTSAIASSGYSDPLIHSASIGSTYDEPAFTTTVVGGSSYSDPSVVAVELGSRYNDPVLASDYSSSNYDSGVVLSGAANLGGAIGFEVGATHGYDHNAVRFAGCGSVPPECRARQVNPRFHSGAFKYTFDHTINTCVRVGVCATCATLSGPQDNLFNSLFSCRRACL